MQGFVFGGVMAIFVVDGKIGAGKTYYAVYYLLKKYYLYDEIMNEYFPRSDFILVSNIDSLKLEHIALDFEIERLGLEAVFCEDYIKTLRGNRKCPVVFLIDEAQGPNLFHRKYYNEKVFFFFQYSRHYGCDIFLLTQDKDSLSRELKTLPEHTIHAVSRTLTSGFNFHYKFIVDDEVIKNLVVKIDKKVFKVYHSFNFDENEKPRPVFIRYIVFMGVAFACAALIFFFVFTKTFTKYTKEDQFKPFIKSGDVVMKMIDGKDHYFNKSGVEVDIKAGKVVLLNNRPPDDKKVSDSPPSHDGVFVPPSPVNNLNPSSSPSPAVTGEMLLASMRSYSYVNEHCVHYTDISFTISDSPDKPFKSEKFVCGEYEVNFHNKKLWGSVYKIDRVLVASHDPVINTVVAAPVSAPVAVDKSPDVPPVASGDIKKPDLFKRSDGIIIVNPGRKEEASGG